MVIAKRNITNAFTDSTAKSGYVWLLPALVAGVVVSLVYLQTHPYPAFGAGLFLLMAEQVSQHNYALPTTIPHYASPIPFAYPPLMFYVVAAIRDAFGIDPLVISRVLPNFVTLVTLVPCFLFVRELLGSARQAGLATFVVAVSPPILQWHLSAGGIVRAPAFLFLVTGLYTGLMLFKTRRVKWLVFSLALFSLTILTHPTYTVFFVLSYLCLFAGFSRTIDGLKDGAIVGCGGIALTSVWWGQILAVHGTAVFSGAAGTHGGLAQKIPNVLGWIRPLLVPSGFKVASGTHSPALISLGPWIIGLGTVGVLQIIGGVLLAFGAAASFIIDEESQSKFVALVSDLTETVRNERAVLPVFSSLPYPRVLGFLLGWLLLSVTVISQHRFAYLIHSIFVAVLVYEFLLPTLSDLTPPRIERHHVEFGVLLVLGVACLSGGVLYAASELDTHSGSSSLPAFIDDNDAAAMTWAAENTEQTAQFLVMGDAAEWFPQSTDRAITTGPWGVEWKGSEAYDAQLSQFIDVSTCTDAACVSHAIEQANVQPDYVYVPTDDYTVRGMETAPSNSLRASLIEADGYTLAYENEGVMIFRVTAEATAPSMTTDQQFEPLASDSRVASDHPAGLEENQ